MAKRRRARENPRGTIYYIVGGIAAVGVVGAIVYLVTKKPAALPEERRGGVVDDVGGARDGKLPVDPPPNGKPPPGGNGGPMMTWAAAKSIVDVAQGSYDKWKAGTLATASTLVWLKQAVTAVQRLVSIGGTRRDGEDLAALLPSLQAKLNEVDQAALIQASTALYGNGGTALYFGGNGGGNGDAPAMCFNTSTQEWGPC